MRSVRNGWERKHTFSKTTAEREGGLNKGPKHEGFLSAVKIGETAEEEEQTAGAKGKARDEPLQLVGWDSKVVADRWKSNSHGSVRRSL